jgi:DNA-binding CsgD family transcriptional regulator
MIDWWHRYHDIHAEASGILRACFAANGRWIAAIQVVRDQPKRLVRAGDIGFVRLLAPLIGRVLHQSYERERALQTTAVGPDMSGILVMGGNKQIQVCTPAAEAWIELLGGSGLPFSGNLPTAIWAAIARLRADLKSPLERALYVWTPAGNLRIEASKSNMDGSMAIVLAPERPPIPPDLPMHWALTPQERQIVLMLVRGMSNRQIASALTIGENTVESHLAHVYEKLSVHSRRELLACLFRDVYWTQMQLVLAIKIAPTQTKFAFAN